MAEDHAGRQYIDPRLLALIDEAEGMPWLFVENLQTGDVLEVQTMNTLYTMKVLDPKNHKVLVNSNGRHITRETRGAVVGTTLTGTGTKVKAGGIAPGLRLVLWVEGKGELVLSLTQEVRVNGNTVLSVATEDDDDQLVEQPERPFLGGQRVRCKACGREYICTPSDDYYNSTNAEDGVCEPCLLKEAGIEEPAISVDDLP